MPAENPGTARVGLISDTHGWLDPRAVAALEREAPLSAIIHAGDIGAADVIYELEAIAPVTAVLGNCDVQLPGIDLEGYAQVRIGGSCIGVIHDLHALGPIPEGLDVVVRGHSHIPSVQWHGRVLVVNPGSATQRRSQPSCTVGVLEIAEDGTPSASIIDLDELGPRLR